MTGGGSSCGACKFLRRRCIPDCMFKPYFSYERSAAHFAAVHKVFGASNASKMLLHLPVHSRGDAAAMICYEAIARVQDPVYGCVAHIFALQHQVAMLEEEIENIEKKMAETSGFHAAAPFSVDQLLLSADASVNLACCSNVEMQRDLGLESSDFENLLQELSEDYYLEHHE